MFDTMHHNTASAQSFSCDADVSKPLCPGTVVTCTCLVTGTVSYTQWIFNRLCPSARNYLAIQQVTPCANLSGTCGPYITATNYASSTSACQISKLKVTMATGVNGLTTECRDTTTGLPGTFIGNGSFTVLDVPGPPVISVSIGSHLELTVTWTPPTTGGVPTSYNVTINDSSSPVVIADNGSPVYTHTFTGLVSDTLYTVSVVAINCAGQNLTSTRAFMSPPPSFSSLSTPLPIPSPPPLMPSLSPQFEVLQVSVDAVGTYLAITFVTSFTTGMLVATIILRACYVPSKSQPPQVYHFTSPLPHTDWSTTVPSEYNITGTVDQIVIKEDESKMESVELENNDAYGTLQ
ncbi:hypothetical protein EMCRGX_G012322 [Ephydatia muelleri]|eukprot:Em0006g111a